MRILGIIFLLLLAVTATASNKFISRSSDLPVTVSTSNDTVWFMGDGFTAAGRVLTINGGVTGTVIQGQNFTTYGGSVDQGAGTLFLVLDGGTNTKFMDWNLRQTYPAANDSVQAFRLGGSIGHAFINVSCYVSGYESQCIYTDGSGGINIEGGHWASSAPGFLTRENFTTALMWFNDNGHIGGYYDGGVIAQDIPYRVRVYGITIDSCPFAGIVVRGNGITVVDSNTIYMQTHNDRYSYPSGNMMCGAANCFAIVVGRNVPGHDGYCSQVSRNTIRALGGSGSARAKEGGNGIAIGGSYLTLAGSMRVWGNDARISQGPDDYYGFGIPSQAFKTEEGLDTLLMYDNYFETYADTTSTTTDINRMANTVWLAEGAGDSYWYLHNNTFKTTLTGGSIAGFDDGTNAYAVALETNCLHGTVQFQDNMISSNCVPVHFGSRNGLESCDINFNGDTLARPGTRYADGSSDSGAVVLYDACLDNYFIDPVFQNDSTFGFDGTGPYEMTLERNFVPVVLGSNGAPLAGVRVRIHNAYDHLVAIDTTDADGRIADNNVAFRYVHAGVGSDSTYSPFTISAIYGSDSVAITESSVGWNTNLIDTITMSAMGGIEVVAPVTIATGLSTDCNMKIPRSKVGNQGTRLMGTPEQSSDGQAAFHFSEDSGSVWIGVTGTRLNSEAYTQGHQACFFQNGVGTHVGLCGSTESLYRFIAYPCTQNSDIGTLRTIRTVSGGPRVSVAASGTRTFCASRSQTTGVMDTIWLDWSDDRFGSITGSQALYVGGATDNNRIHLVVNDSGTVSLFLFKYNGGSAGTIRRYQFNGTLFTKPPDSIFTTLYVGAPDRSIGFTSTPGYWHAFMSYGEVSTPTPIMHFKSNGTTIVRDTVSSTTTIGLGNTISVSAKGDSLACYYEVGTGQVVKFYDAIDGWDADSTLVTGATVLADNNFQSPDFMPSDLPFWWYTWITTGGAYMFGKVNISGGAVELPDTAETVSAPTTPTGPDSTVTGELEWFYTSGGSSNLGHSLEYRFDWDGETSAWSVSDSASHVWIYPGTYDVRAQARCATHTDIVSSWSTTHITITGAPEEPPLSSKLIKGMRKP